MQQIDRSISPEAQSDATPQARVPWHYRAAALGDLVVAAELLYGGIWIAVVARNPAPDKLGPLILSAIFNGMAILVLAFGLVWLAVAAGTWRGRPWALIATVILHAIVMLISGVPGALASGDLSRGQLVVGLVGLLCIVAVLLGRLRTIPSNE
jgi:hypothetical protein